MASSSDGILPDCGQNLPHGGDKPALPQAFELREHMEDVRHMSAILKALAHESRLIILCALMNGDKSVSELETILALRQPAVSQQLARLRGDKLVRTHREGKMIYYTLSDDPQVRAIVQFLCELFRKNLEAGAGATS